MADKFVENGATDVVTYFCLRDSTNHAPKTDVTITDIDLYYQPEGAAQSAKADATALAAADSAHADNKAYHCGNGIYRIDWPDAAFDGGSGTEVVLIAVCSGVDDTHLRVALTPSIGVTSTVNDASATTTSFVTNLASTTDNFYNNAFLLFTSGALKGQCREISDYDGSSKTITLATALTSAPADTVEFVIVGRSE